MSEIPGVDIKEDSSPEKSLGRSAFFRDGDPVIFNDRKGRKYLWMVSEKPCNLRGGLIEAKTVIGAASGTLFHSSSGEPVRGYHATLEEYVLLMPRGAQIIPPKDVGFITQFGDIFPGAHVVEAGIGSGSLTLGLMRAIGRSGSLVSFEVREDFINLARKNINRWPDYTPENHDIRLGDVYEEIGSLSGIDRVVLDLAEPWRALDGAAKALQPGALLLIYVPSIRQIDQFVMAVMDHREYRDVEVAEVLLRPWVADRVRLRPSLKMVGHSGFVARVRRRSREDDPEDLPANPTIATGDESE